jgi:hypothetical protein
MRKQPILISDYLANRKDKSILSQIFNSTPPAMKTWTDPIDIITILDIIAGSKPSHCAYLPGGGYIFLDNAELFSGRSIDLISNIRHRLNAKKLTLVTLGTEDYYFLLESNESKPSGLVNNNSKVAIAETVAEFYPGQYIDRKFHDNYDSYEDNFGAYQEQFPERPHLVRRYLKESSVLIVKNDNPYTFTRFASDSFHNQVSHEELKDVMQNLFMQLQMTNP